jgi:hypothetical protein
MSALDTIKKYSTGDSVQSDTSEAPAPTSATYYANAPKSTGISDKIAVDATQTNEILARMQEFIDQRQSPFSLLMGGLNKAYATTYGPGAALEYEKQQQAEDKQVLDYRTQMAAYRAAQSQAERDAAIYAKKMGTGSAGGAAPSPGAGAGETSQGEMTWDGIPVPATVKARLKGNSAHDTPILNEWLKTQTTEAIKKEQAPGMADMVDVYVPGEGNVQMTKKMAEKMLEADPRLQAIVNGKRVPAAKVIREMPATGPVSFSDPSIKIISGQRSTEAQQKLYDASVKNGTPGIQPNGLPVAKPGTSAHEKGEGAAFDIDPKKLTKSGRTELAQKGYYQPLGMDSPHWERIPSATPAAPAPARLESRSDYNRRIKEEGQIGESRIKEGEVERGETLTARKSSIETGTAISRIEAVLNTPEGALAVGQFSKPGVAAAFGKILSEGIQAGNFGAVKFNGLEDAVRQAGGNQKVIDAAQMLARDFAQMQLNIAKRDLKGQGAVSDNERAIVARVTGSTANSPEVLKDFVRWNRVRNDFDKQVGDALQRWEKENPGLSYTKFKESTNYTNLEKAYIAKTDEMASKMGLSGTKAAPSDNKAKVAEALKLYGTKKEPQ